MRISARKHTRTATRLLAVAALVGGAAAATAGAANAATPTQYGYANNLYGWIAQAQSVLAADGDHVPPADAIAARAMTESSGNPLAQNHWDGNQALYGGTYGLMQTITPTFDTWALPGYGDIMNPVDNIIASVRYANHTYGAFENIAYGTNGY
ncbi:transglycosylase SLT domain-containing protein [Streptacidiphilus sp. EB129]|uniref:transglycosylase SLT domain-containing protein n=1 Tax=Streptacidiphilus sp. EB129 TaxID=3156262 RepID=UPI0035110A71